VCSCEVWGAMHWKYWKVTFFLSPHNTISFLYSSSYFSMLHIFRDILQIQILHRVELVVVHV
jgi:hypothetical protein